ESATRAGPREQPDMRLNSIRLSTPTGLNPLLHLKQYFIRKIAKKNDLSPQPIMRLHGALISIVGVCSPTSRRRRLGAAWSGDTGPPRSSE
ncbi:Nonribosomal peptide synthase dtpA, partial [Dissostichus eleginoides]